MRNAKEIRAEIKALRQEMRANGVPRRACFNGGHTPESYRLNARLFALSAELEKAGAT